MSRRKADPRSAPSASERTDFIVSTLTEAFSVVMDADPAAFRNRFRTMAGDPFAFYRGTACLFYADVGSGGSFADADQSWVAQEGSRRVWIQGDLHAENFGTYMDARGRLVFDVNDFDEAYLGHWTWDLMRFCASLGLLCWRKALPDETIHSLVEVYLRAYADQVRHYVQQEDDSRWALTLETATGAVLDALHRAKLSTRVGLLDSTTVVENYARRFAEGSGVRQLGKKERATVAKAFQRYQDTLLTTNSGTVVTFDVLDVVGKKGFGIGSAGLPAYSVLIEGFTQALDNDVVLTLKQANVASPSRVVVDPEVAGLFEHHGHRTALSQRALQANADRFLGWTELKGAGGEQTGFVVSEYSPYEADLEWGPLNEPDAMREVVEQLGRATAKIHCVADDDSEHDVVKVSVEEVVTGCIGDREDEFVADMVRFTQAYSQQVRTDHALFVDAFRGGAFSAVAPA